MHSEPKTLSRGRPSLRTAGEIPGVVSDHAGLEMHLRFLTRNGLNFFKRDLFSLTDEYKGEPSPLVKMPL